jgi:hypothetical protein
MPVILIIEKNANVKELAVKNYKEEDLYKKAGFKTSDGFIVHAKWLVELEKKRYNIFLYGKKTGKANQENKYELPPPVDNLLLFGNCVLVNKKENDEIENLSLKEWKSIYENLYGGFEDLNDTKFEDEEEDEDLTKEGYAKDGFIVDDKE